jgi:hypothetical protein
MGLIKAIMTGGAGDSRKRRSFALGYPGWNWLSLGVLGDACAIELIIAFGISASEAAGSQLWSCVTPSGREFEMSG